MKSEMQILCFTEAERGKVVLGVHKQTFSHCIELHVVLLHLFLHAVLPIPVAITMDTNLTATGILPTMGQILPQAALSPVTETNPPR